MYRNSMDICRTAGLQISEFCFSDPLGQAPNCTVFGLFLKPAWLGPTNSQIWDHWQLCFETLQCRNATLPYSSQTLQGKTISYWEHHLRTDRF